MRRARLPAMLGALGLAGACLVGASLAGLMLERSALAQQPKGSAAPTAKPPGSARPQASAAPASSAGPATAPMADPHGAALPPGHPGAAPNGADPHAGDPHGGQPPRAPVDEVMLDGELPAGTVAARLVDATEQPIAGAEVVLDIDRNTVAQGESHEERVLRTDEAGAIRVDGLKIGTSVTYRLRTLRGGGTFTSPSFSLKEEGGIRVLLHAHETVSALAQAIVAMEAMVVLEVKQDTVRVNHLLRIYNFGRTAYVANDLAMTLPAGARAFSQEQSEAGLQLRERSGVVAFEGTLPPGKIELTYGYTLPLAGDASLRLELPMPPRVLAAQVSVNAGAGMTLAVEGFQPAQATRRRDGQRVLVAIRQMDPSRNPQEFLADVQNGSFAVTVGGLPSTGQAPLVAGVLAVLALAGGALAVARKGSTADRIELGRELGEARDALLEELAALERARSSGEVGPKSYERLREALLDALARILARIDASASPPARR